MPTKTKSTPKSRSFNEKISFTSHGVAYRRAKFMKIPLAKKIYKALVNIQGPLEGKEKERAQARPEIVPYFESRYIITDFLLKQSGVKNVVELAAGLSPRGMAWVRDHDEGTYVEIDLPAESMLKKLVIKKMMGKAFRPPDRLVLEDGNVTDPKVIASALEYYMDAGPVAFICEGLLRYLNWKDKARLARTIFHYIERRGGCWITPDLEFLADIKESPELTRHYDLMAKEWDMDVRPYLFKDMDDAKRFFEEFGFEVIRYYHLDWIDDLVSPKQLKLKRSIVEKDLRMRSTFLLVIES